MYFIKSAKLESDYDIHSNNFLTPKQLFLQFISPVIFLYQKNIE